MAGKFAFGTQLKVTIGAVLTAIANLTNINGVEITADEIDVTDHDSDDGYREYAQGLKDGGSVSIEGHFLNDTTQIALKTLLDSGTAVPCEINFPSALAKWTFDAFVTSIGTEEPFDDKIAFKATLKITGKPELVTGA